MVLIENGIWFIWLLYTGHGAPISPTGVDIYPGPLLTQLEDFVDNSDATEEQRLSWFKRDKRTVGEGGEYRTGPPLEKGGACAPGIEYKSHASPPAFNPEDLEKPNGTAIACHSIDGRRVVYDHECEEIDAGAGKAMGCYANGIRGCRRCRGSECDEKDSSIPRKLTINGGNFSLFEGDILLTKSVSSWLNDQMTINQALISLVDDDTTSESTFAKNAIRDRRKLWTNKHVYYFISPSFVQSEQAEIRAAISELQRISCITFTETTTGSGNYIYVYKGSGCFSQVGMTGGMQPLSLGSGCVSKGIIMHEFMHALGFFHEQSRADRDSYIRINWENVLAGTNGNFIKYTLSEIDHLGQPYDYDSIMHYTTYSFSKNGQETITPLQKVDIAGAYNRITPSRIDIRKINILYSCSDHRPLSTESPITTAPDGSSSSSTATSVITGGGCKDKLEVCQSWSTSGFCDGTLFMKIACPKSCNYACPNQNKCEDSSPTCKWWYDQANGKCTQYLNIVCAKTCNQC